VGRVCGVVVVLIRKSLRHAKVEIVNTMAGAHVGRWALTCSET
jgi:hypothetical protein